MKIEFRGELTLPELGLAMTKTKRPIGFDPETQVIQGCTVYFNVYDRSTGDPLPEVAGKMEAEAWESAPAVGRELPL